MPILKGTDADTRHIGYKGTLVAYYDVVNLRVPPDQNIAQVIVELLEFRIRRAAVEFARDLIRQGLYCTGVQDVNLIAGEKSTYDVSLVAKVRELNETLSIDEMEMYADSMGAAVANSILQERNALTIRGDIGGAFSMPGLQVEVAPQERKPTQKMQIVRQKKYSNGL